MKRDLSLFLKMELGIKDSGKETSGMVSALRYGLMVQNMKATGKTTKPMEGAYSGMFTETNTKANGREIRRTALGNTLIATGLLMKETGVMTCNMDKVLSSGTTTQSIRDSTKKEKSTE